MMNLKKWFHKIIQSVWAIGFIETDIDDIIAGKAYKVKWVDIPVDCWYADPFILNVTKDKIELLVEEWKYDLERGVISKIIIDKGTNKITYKKTILQLDTHLSFPAIYRKNGEVYVCPENSESGCSNIYKYDELNELLVFHKKLCNQPLTDSVITDLLGDNLMFSTKVGNSNGKILNIYRWVPNQCLYEDVSSVSFDENIARMAGHFFKHKDSIYRPAQVSNSAYGQAVSLQKVEAKEGTINFVEIRRLYSDHKNLTQGMHTFNYNQGLIVVDAWGWKAPILRKLFVDDWGNMKKWILWFGKLLGQ